MISKFRNNIQRFHSRLILLGSVCVMLAVGALLGTHFMLGSVVLGGGVMAVVVFLWPETALLASIVSIVLGQLVRIPIGDSAILPNDIILPALIIAWSLRRAASRSWPILRQSLTLPLILMMLVMGLSLAFNLGRENPNEVLSGAFYFIRWLEYAALFWIGLDLFRSPTRAASYLRYLVWATVALALLGFIQLKAFPDFSFMVPQGWDPHVGRLLSTWFDPNFLGGLFALLLSITISVALFSPWRSARWWWAAAGIIAVATLLTFSRSGYVGLVVALGIVGLFRSRVALFLGILAIIATILFVPRVQERVIGIRTIDETAKLRLVSYNNAFQVIGDHPVIGIGYNLYKYVQVEYNFLEKTSEHSASGSDSSILTIWVTTGTIGLLIYLWLFIAMLREAWKTWHDTHVTAQWRGFGLGLFAGLIGLFAHSQFVNGLQYPHLMEMMWLLVAMAIAVRQFHTQE